MSVKPSPIATATADISSLSAENFITPSKEGKKDDIGLDLNDVVLTDEVKGLLCQLMESLKKNKKEHPPISTAGTRLDMDVSTPRTIPRSVEYIATPMVTGVPNGNTSLGPKQPVDLNEKFPDPPLLKLADVSADEFTVWYDKMLSITKGLSKFEGLLEFPCEKSWPIFLANNSKYPEDQLQSHYLRALKATWSFIYSSIDGRLATRISREMSAERDKYNVTKMLNFRIKLDTYYEDPHSFFNMIANQYVRPSNFRLSDIFRDLQNLKYRKGEDPKSFIQKYHEIHSKGKLLVPNFPHYDDEAKAHDMLSRLPAECDFIRNNFLGRKASATITVKDVEEILKDWWITQGSNDRNHYRNRDERKPATAASAYKSSHSNRDRSKSPHHGSGKHQNTKPNKSHSNGRKVSFSEGKERQNKPSDIEDSYPSEHSLTIIALGGQDSYNDDEVISASTTTGHYIPRSNDLIFDTGASVPVTGRKDLLEDFETIPTLRIGTLGGERTVKHQGKLRISSRVNIKNTRYLPAAPYSLLSVSQACKAGYQVVFTETAGYILPPRTVPTENLASKSILSAKQQGGLYIYKLQDELDEDEKKNFVVSNKKDNYRQSAITQRIPRKEMQPSDLVNVPTTETLRDDLEFHRKQKQNLSAQSEIKEGKDPQGQNIAHANVVQTRSKNAPMQAMSDMQTRKANISPTNTMDAVSKQLIPPDSGNHDDQNDF